MRILYVFVLLVCVQQGWVDAQIQWRNDLGPWGGDVRHVYEAADGELLAVTDEGLFTSTDQRSRWSAIPFAQTQYVSTYRASSGTLFAYRDSSVLRCPSGEPDWTDGVTGIHIIGVYQRHQYGAGFFEHSSGRIFCGGYSSAYFTEDDGKTWKGFPLNRHSDGAAYWSEDAAGTIFTGGESIHPPDMSTREIREIQLRGERTFVSHTHALGAGHRIAWSGYPDGWLLSTDGGANWTVTFATPQRIDPWQVSPSRSGRALALFDSSVAMFTTDRGEHWQYAPPIPSAFHDISGSFCTSIGEMYVATKFPGVLRLDMDSWTWVPQMRGMLQAAVSSVRQSSGGTMYAVLPDEQSVLARNPDGSWEALFQAPQPVSDFRGLPSGTLLIASRGAGLFTSVDAGGTWTGNGPAGRTVECLLPLEGGRVLAGCTPGLLVSDDDGVSWLSVPACESLDIETMCARFSGEIVLGGEFGVVVLSADLRILHQSRPSWLPVISLAADAAAGIYAGTLGDGLYRSIDDGLTWTHLGLEGEEITGIVPSDEDFCFVATRTHGIFETRDGGRQWHAYGEGLRSEEILDLHAGYDGFLYAGTVAGVAKSALPVLTARYLAPDFTLSQSSPNPAIGTATFSWSVPRAGKVRMSIYDILGRQQRVIFDRLETAGLFSENVDTGGLLSGTYFCVLGFEGNMLVEKFQVLR